MCRQAGGLARMGHRPAKQSAEAHGTELGWGASSSKCPPHMHMCMHTQMYPNSVHGGWQQ